MTLAKGDARKANTRTYRRAATYAVTTAVLWLGYFPLARAPWHSSDSLHTVLESVATLLALFVAMVALVRYHSRPNDVFLFFGAAFLGTAILDGYHVAVSSAFVAHHTALALAPFPSPLDTRAAFSWFFARMLLAVLLLESIRAVGRASPAEDGGTRSRQVLLAVGLLALLGSLVVLFVPLQSYWSSGGEPSRPAEILPGALFAVSLALVLREGKWKQHDFEHWLVLALIFSVFTHVPYMWRAPGLGTALFDFAHVLKIISYTCVLTGLVLNMEALFRRADESSRTMAKANEALSREIEVRRKAEASVRLYQEIVENVQIGLVVLRLENLDDPASFRTISFNSAALRVLGLSATDSADDSAAQLLSDSSPNLLQSGLLEVFRGVLLSGQPKDLGEVAYGDELIKEGVYAVKAFPLAHQCLGLAFEDITWRRRAAEENAEAWQRLADSRESERLHLAQELHDVPLQELHGVRMRLVQLADIQSNNEGQSAIGEVQDALRDAIKRLRSICNELRPPALSPFGLEVAIRSHAEHFRSAHPKIHLELDLESDKLRLPERTRLALYRIYQHALENVARHAEADHARVVLKLDRDQVTLRIRDDGRGFELPANWLEPARSGHLGLLGASERAAAIGGQLEVESAPGEGTLVQVTAPIPVGEEPVEPNGKSIARVEN